MPMDSVQQSPIWEDYFYDRCTVETCRSWLPRRCYISNRLLWFKNAVRCERKITGPGEPVYDIRWHDTNEYFLMKLKG